MANGETQIWPSRSDTGIRIKFLANLAALGYAHGALGGNNDAANWYSKAQEELRTAYENNRDIDPPKSPPRPNARIGGLALGESF